MDYIQYYDNQNSIKSPTEAIKYEFVRLISFKDIQNLIKLAVTQLASFGFYFDPKQNSIKCSDCSFTYTHLNVDTFYELLNEHVKYTTQQHAKCTFRNNHIKYVESLMKDKKSDSSQNKIKPPKKFETEAGRTESFEGVEIELDIPELVKNGFYLVNEASLSSNLRKIKCYFCEYECLIFRKGKLNNYYETPFDDHEMKSPNCELIIEKNKNKNEIDGFTHGNIFLSMKNTDTINTIQYNINGNSNFDLLKTILNKSMNATCDKPFHPGYATEQSRVESFREWPMNLAQQPNDLAKAGFYYYGIKDMVKCFYCNGGLRNWDPIDEPITEHARWFPKCPYIRQLKGASFIEEIRERYKDMDSGFKDDYDDTPQYYDVVNNNENNNVTNNNTNNNSIQVRKRSISPRTINSRMDLPSIQKIIKLPGFTRNMVKQVIENRLSEQTDDFPNYIELIKACYRMKDSSKKLEQQFQEAFHFYISNISMDVTYKQVCELFRSKFSAVPIQINKIIDPNNPSIGTLLIRLKSDDISKCDRIVNDLNEKPFPGISSQNKIIVKKISDKIVSKENIEPKLNPIDSKAESSKPQIKKFKKDDDNGGIIEPMDEDLAEEVEKLKKERACVICFDRQKVIMFLPCAHLAACVECSVAMQTCPICRKKVEATIRTYV